MGRLDRWARFFEPRVITGLEMLQDEVVKSFAQDLASWPPPVEQWFDAALRERFAPVLSPFCPRPSPAVFRAAIELAIQELQREYEAIDAFYRNDRAASISGDERERLALLFLHRWLTDAMLELLEAVPRFKRPHLVECLERIAKRLDAPFN